MANDKRRRVRKRGVYSDDPLVPIDGPRLRAAIEWRGLAINAVARKMVERQSTLNSIVNGEVKRCRHKRRLALAKILRVPAGWLGGVGDLPDVPGYEVQRMPNVRQEDGRVRDMYYVKVSGESGVRGPLTEAPTLPPRVQLEAREAIQVLRLLFDPDGSPFPVGWNRRHWSVSPDYRSREALELRNLERIPQDVLAMFTLESWRSMVFGSQRRPWYPAPEESDKFAEALGTALRLILAPAIDGNAYFDVPARRSVLAAQYWLGRRRSGDLSEG